MVGIIETYKREVVDELILILLSINQQVRAFLRDTQILKF